MSQTYEIQGRTLLKSFLDQVEAVDQVEAEGKYNPVDYYFTYKGKTAVAEIKVRDKQYEGCSTHLMELKKYKALVKDKADKNLDVAYYINFFVDETTTTAYWYNVGSIKGNAKVDSYYCNRNTASYCGRTDKDVLLISTDIAKVYRLENNKWVKG